MFRSLQWSQRKTGCFTTVSLVNQTEINPRSVKNHRWTAILSLSSRPLQPSQLIPTSSSPPSANSWVLPKTPSQLIRHCLLPLEPVHNRPPRSQQGFPLKPLHWWPPGMSVALGTGRTGLDREVGVWKLNNRTSPIMLICWGKTVKIWRETKGKAFHSQGSEAPPASGHLLAPPSERHKQVYTPGICHTWENTALA